MRNTIRSNQTVTEEERKKILDMDWNSYYRETMPPEMQGLFNCIACGAILVVREEHAEKKCYNCGHTIKPNDGD